jgi:hypothetical protein
MTGKQQRPVHLVGSVPLSNSREVFDEVSTGLGPLILRIPDGETGERSHWVGFQSQVMEAIPNFTRIDDAVPGSPVTVFGMKNPREPLDFGPLGYASAAIASYREFKALKAAGQIEAKTRFQVSVPTPLAVMGLLLEKSCQSFAEPSYETRLMAELTEIFSAIPLDQLAIQWDVCYEVVIMAGWADANYHDKSEPRMLEKLVRLSEAVPKDVELGFHLCYGDPGHKHVIEPVDLALCVEISNVLTERVRRTIDWIHMPVPRDRDDEAYFAPLRDLKLAKETQVFLGLVHLTDGVEGGSRRIAMAERFRANFGIATECGFGRRPPETVTDLLHLHKQLASA